MNALRLALVCLACMGPLAATAQWMWLDKDGRKVFSDRAPPPEIAPHRILRQPGVRGPAPAQPAAAAAAPPVAAPAGTAAPANVPQLTGRERALEERKKQVEAAEAEKKKAEEERLAQLQADNCRRARAGKLDLSSGMRIARINDKGEREILDDQQKAVEIQRLDAIIARDCKSPAAPGVQ